MTHYRHTILPVILLCVIMPALCSARQASLPAGPVSSPATTLAPIPGTRQFVVPEPVFNGTAFIAEAGTENSRTLVLVHGMGDRAANDWEEVMPELAKQYHILALDLPGFGRSSKGNNLYSPAQYAAFIKWVVDNYARKPFVLIGHSLGGAIALKYASLYPEQLDRLILVDAAGILHHVSLSKELVFPQGRTGFGKGVPLPVGELGSIVRSVLDNISNDERADKLEQALNSAALRKAMLNGDPKKISGTAMMLDDYSRVVDEVRIPALLIWGENDTVAPLRTARALAGRLPDARLEIIPQTGHSPMLERPKAFNRIVLDELASSGTRTPVEQGDQKLPERTVRYERKKDFSISGAYKTIELIRCDNVTMNDVTAGEITIRDSKVIMENSTIRGSQVGLKATKSEIIATNVRIMADIPIQASRSRLDFAGAYLIGKKAAATTDSRSLFIFSISRAESAHYTGPLHGIHRLTKEQLL